MGSQRVTVLGGWVALALAWACSQPTNPAVSAISAPLDAPDLSLLGVAFARSSEGQVVARGTAERLDYQRPGGRVRASRASAIIYPEEGTGLATLGTVRVLARDVDGEVPSRRGTASGGVRADAARGDTALTDRVDLDGSWLRGSAPVTASGPGYRVNGNGILARTDGTSIQLNSGVRGQMRMEGPR